MLVFDNGKYQVWVGHLGFNYMRSDGGKWVSFKPDVMTKELLDALCSRILELWPDSEWDKVNA